MFMHWLFCAVIQYAFDLPILPFAGMVEENLANEIDFRKESKNANICRENFKITGRDKKVYIP